MTTIDFNETLDRIVLIEKQALAALSTPVTADAVPYFLHQQEAFPYWTNRIGPGAIVGDSEDFDYDSHTLIARLVIGHATEGYVGQPENSLYTYITQFKTYMHAREGLQTDQTTPTDLSDWQRYLIRARIVSTTGFRIWQMSGISAQQVGAEFNILCEFEETITSAAF
jgi:hypothetical protein